MASEQLQVVRTVTELRGVVRDWRRAGNQVALVPTMGALHQGHLSLAEAGRAVADRVVMSIFVNPTQFAPGEDLDSYPRTFEDDVAKFAGVGGHLVWAPTPGEMYPDGFATRVVPEGAALGLETDFRPNFFAGVATVCTKLFTQTLPDFAMFGEKDYQQLCVVRQIVRDLDLPMEIVGCPTVREPDGLAMSSRNAYLSAAERAQSVALNEALERVGNDLDAGKSAEAATDAARKHLTANGFGPIDYVAVRDAATLAPVARADGRALRILVAAWLGKTRLIDNVAFGASSFTN